MFRSVNLDGSKPEEVTGGVDYEKGCFLILSTGWIVTLLVLLYLNIAFLENEAYPIIYKAGSQLNSFPYIHAIKTLLNITAVWFCFVLIRNVIFSYEICTT